MIHSTIVWAALVATVLAIGIWLFAWPVWRRRRLLRRPFPSAWLTILRHQLPFYDRLPAEQQSQLQHMVTLFLADKRFVGCAGQEIDDEIRLTIAGQACLLLLNHPSRGYAGLHSIYVYPTTFRARHEARDAAGLVTSGTRTLLGESWSNGKVILAWDDVARGVRNFHVGHNVVLHEFAHQLDHESGTTNGAPLLASKAAYRSWAQVFRREFEALKRHHGIHGVIDRYGATDPAEFFAVATEAFFEEPEQLHRYHRELFEQLQSYYRLDPREWQ